MDRSYWEVSIAICLKVYTRESVCMVDAQCLFWQAVLLCTSCVMVCIKLTVGVWVCLQKVERAASEIRLLRKKIWREDSMQNVVCFDASPCNSLCDNHKDYGQWQYWLCIMQQCLFNLTLLAVDECLCNLEQNSRQMVMYLYRAKHD